MDSFKIQHKKPLLISLVLIDMLFIIFEIYLALENVLIYIDTGSFLSKETVLIVSLVFILFFTAVIFYLFRYKVIVSADKLVVRKVFSEKEFSINEIGFVDVTKYSKYGIKNTYFNVYFKNTKSKLRFGANYKNADKLLEILANKGFVSRSINKIHSRRL